MRTPWKESYDLDNIFKSRDITLPTKFRLVEAMVLPVVMYGCESWTVKKAERQRMDAFELWFDIFTYAQVSGKRDQLETR